MKNFLIIWFIVLFTYSFVNANEQEQRKSIIEQGAKLFQQNDLSILSKVATEYLKTEERTFSGKWKLRLLYSGVFSTFNINIKDSEYWEKLENKVESWMKKEPNSTMAHIVYASVFAHKAWMYRGRSAARYVSKENWDLFHKEIIKSNSILEKYHDVAVNDPQYYVQLLSNKRSEGVDRKTFLKLAREALKKYPYYYTIYEFILHYMSPNWNNFSKIEIENFAQEIVQVNEGVEKDEVYARFYLIAKKDMYKNGLFYASGINWKNMSTSMDKILEKYPSQYNINNFAYISCLSGDKEKTAKLIDKIADGPMMSIWKNNNIYEKCKLLNKHVSNKTLVKVINPKDLVNYIQTNKNNRPLFIYFSSYDEKSPINDIELLKDIAKNFINVIDFISVNYYPEIKAYKYPQIYHDYAIKYLPSFMFNVDKKIISRKYISILTEKNRKYIKNRLKDLLKDLKKENFLERFKETIIDDESFLNSMDMIRLIDSKYDPKGNIFAARAYALDREQGKFAQGYSSYKTNQREGNIDALDLCKKRSKFLKIDAECILYNSGVNYVYDKNITEIK